MLSKPMIVERAEQPYAAIRAKLAMQEIGRAADQLAPQLFGWLGAHRIGPAGAPFFKYNVIDMARQLEIEWGVPTAISIQPDGPVLGGILPAGRYSTLIHRGPYDGLVDANAALLKWVADSGLTVDVTQTPAGDKFGCRLEIYLTDPRTEPDPEKWETEVAFLLADQPESAIVQKP
ncbi:effector-binding domain-containing protein [Rhizobiales bacterium GAS191]|jgi:effector-binding domain-containing protein|nr:effector-binding domain-containing protein [Rhizobiales bacterium GAS188]SED29552.1 effector-binding domain-containing protein [Rhizobiales bacterium GAS191]